MYSAAFATATEFKSRLGISDTVDDTVIADLLLGVSAAMERFTGRALRRQHCRIETMVGGKSSIRVKVYPVAAIHWVRWSDIGDFVDPDNYDELVENEDWIFDARGIGATAGEYGWIRALYGDFPHGQIQVCYTGGYKTSTEVAAENGTLTIDNSTNASTRDAFSVAARYMSGETDPEGYLVSRISADETAYAGLQVSTESIVHRACLAFDTSAIFPPTWEVIRATLVLYANLALGSGSLNGDVTILPVNLRQKMNEPEYSYNLIDDPPLDDDEDETNVLATITRTSSSFSIATIAIHSDTGYRNAMNMKILNRAIRRGGGLAFGVQAATETGGSSLSLGVATPSHSTAGNKPTLTLIHRDPIKDQYTMPDDLRSACLMQAASDFASRKAPALTMETQRGISIASGFSYQRASSSLLPQVKEICQSYAEMV